MQGKIKYPGDGPLVSRKMKLCQRLDNAMNEGIRMSELERRADSLRDRLYGDRDKFGYRDGSYGYKRLMDSSSQTARGAGIIFGSVAVQELDELCQRSNGLSSIRTKRVYAFGDEELSKLERRVEDVGYALGYKIENFRQWCRDLARSYDVWKYDRRRLKAREKGWDAHQFFENEARIREKEEAKKARKRGKVSPHS